MSTIGPVITALAALARTTLPTYQVIPGAVTSVPMTADLVVAVAAEPVVGTSELDSMDVGTRVERYTVPVIVSVSLPGADTEGAAITAAMTAYAAFESAIRAADPDLGIGGAISVMPLGGFELRPTATDAGRQAAVRFAVAVFAQPT